MTNIVGFASKSERERQRLIREARAIYDSIFPPEVLVGTRTDDSPNQWAAHEAAAEIQSKQR